MNKLKQGGGIQTATLGGPAALGTVKVPGCFYVQTPGPYPSSCHKARGGVRPERQTLSHSPLRAI